MASSIFSALKYLPASLAQKALVKVNPKFGNYFSKVAAYGLDVNRALDYLSERFESDSQRGYKDQLSTREAQGLLRPDEMVSKRQIEREEAPGKALRTAAAFGAGGLLGGFGGEEREREPSLSAEDQRQAALGVFNERLRSKKPTSELSREELIRQFEESQQRGQSGPGKAALVSTMKEMTNILRGMRGQGG